MNHRRLMHLFCGLAVTILLPAFSPICAQQAGTGFLKVKANTGRAGVFVDGKYLGPAANFRTAQKHSISAGEHELVLREPRTMLTGVGRQCEPSPGCGVADQPEASG